MIYLFIFVWVIILNQLEKNVVNRNYPDWKKKKCYQDDVLGDIKMYVYFNVNLFRHASLIFIFVIS